MYEYGMAAQMPPAFVRLMQFAGRCRNARGTGSGQDESECNSMRHVDASCPSTCACVCVATSAPTPGATTRKGVGRAPHTTPRTTRWRDGAAQARLNDTRAPVARDGAGRSGSRGGRCGDDPASGDMRGAAAG